MTAVEAQLAASLLSRVWLPDEAARGRDLLDAALRRMLESSTARRLVERYVAAGNRAVLRVDDPANPRAWPESASEPIDFRGPRALLSWSGTRATVTVNAAYLTAEPDWRDIDLPATLAHELLGHAFWYARAEREGIHTAVHHYDQNELYARLVGWLVASELGGRPDATVDDYLRDPYVFRLDLRYLDPHYSLLMSVEEMGHLVATLHGRLLVIDAKRAALQDSHRDVRGALESISHLVRVLSLIHI